MSFQKAEKVLDYRDIAKKEGGDGSKAERLTKFLLESQEKSGQKKFKLDDLIAKKKEKKKKQEMEAKH